MLCTTHERLFERYILVVNENPDYPLQPLRPPKVSACYMQTHHLKAVRDLSRDISQQRQAVLSSSIYLFVYEVRDVYSFLFND